MCTRDSDRRPTIGRVTDWDYTGDDFYCDLAVPHAGELEVVFQDEHVWPTTTPGRLAHPHRGRTETASLLADHRRRR